MKRSSREFSDLETLEPNRGPAPTELIASRTARARSRTVSALALVLAAAFGSMLTITIGHISHRSGRTNAATHAISPMNVASAAPSSTTLPPNFVTRVREPTRLDGWTIVVDGYRLAPIFEQQTPPSGHKWLVAEFTVTNTAGRGHVFDSRRVVGRYFEGGAQPEVPSSWNTDLVPAPNQTVPLELAFSVPSSSEIYSIVVRGDLESEKQAGTAVEIDLNCC
jgi:hypothetical protein